MRASVVDAAAGVIEVSVASPSTEARSRSYLRFGAGRRQQLTGVGDLGGLDAYPSLRKLADNMTFKGFA